MAVYLDHMEAAKHPEFTAAKMACSRC